MCAQTFTWQIFFVVHFAVGQSFLWRRDREMDRDVPRPVLSPWSRIFGELARRRVVVRSAVRLQRRRAAGFHQVRYRINSTSYWRLYTNTHALTWPMSVRKKTVFFWRQFHAGRIGSSYSFKIISWKKTCEQTSLILTDRSIDFVTNVSSLNKMLQLLAASNIEFEWTIVHRLLIDEFDGQRPKKTRSQAKRCITTDKEMLDLWHPWSIVTSRTTRIIR